MIKCVNSVDNAIFVCYNNLVIRKMAQLTKRITDMTYLQIQTELDAIMEKLKTLPSHCQKTEDRKVLNRMYDLVELKNKLIK